MLRAIPLLSALALLLSSTSQAALVSAAPASLPPAPSENASTAFLNDGSESRIGLLCHNDPVNKSDPTGLETPAPMPKDFMWEFALGRDWNQPGLGGPVTLAPIAKENEGAKGVGNSQNRANPPPTNGVVRKPYQSFSRRGPKTGNYLTTIRFKYTVYRDGKPVGPGVPIGEDVSFRDGVDVAPKGPNKGWSTNGRGEAFDDYQIPFYSERGSVRIVQPLTVGGNLHGQWETIVRGNGSFNMISDVKTDQTGDTMILK